MLQDSEFKIAWGCFVMHLSYTITIFFSSSLVTAEILFFLLLWLKNFCFWVVGVAAD
jgi:hypothetical protein